MIVLVLESHISYRVLAFFRSQQQRQSWVSALTTVLDVSALVVVGIEGQPAWQAHVTFAIARHAAVDLSQVLGATPDLSGDRLLLKTWNRFGGSSKRLMMPLPPWWRPRAMRANRESSPKLEGGQHL